MFAKTWRKIIRNVVSVVLCRITAPSRALQMWSPKVKKI